MRVHNLYTDASGQSHFRDIEVDWVEERRGSKLSKRLPATGIIFRETQAEHDIDWPQHRAGNTSSISSRGGDNRQRWCEQGYRYRRGGPGRGHHRQGTLLDDTVSQPPVPKYGSCVGASFVIPHRGASEAACTASKSWR
jgi:hypothetical protein